MKKQKHEIGGGHLLRRVTEKKIDGIKGENGV